MRVHSTSSLIHSGLAAPIRHTANFSSVWASLSDRGHASNTDFQDFAGRAEAASEPLTMGIALAGAEIAYPVGSMSRQMRRRNLSFVNRGVDAPHCA